MQHHIGSNQLGREREGRMDGSKQERSSETKSSDLVLDANEPQSLIPTNSEKQASNNHELEDVSLNDEEEVLDSDDEAVFVGQKMVDEAADFSAVSQTSRTRQRRPLFKINSPKSGDFHFDDNDVDDISDEDPEQAYYKATKQYHRRHQILTDYNIPIGPFESEEYSSPPRASLFRMLPGVQSAQQVLRASTRVVENSVGTAAGGVEAAMTRVQESLAVWPGGLNGGLLDSISEFVAEGMRSLPPSDTIVRPQGRQTSH
ncbi:hypothetical protein FIE12Z_11321 [Fusarium flagelliforme]|uniref:Uncharacterized protein n=1 Tax=Fusarium flagelliforme TaxID=2675880 RepID=A0A395M980_9HYPO|nr:hypothetical protein FIE12Z_11321 [Fusarium flagelliforme]